MSDVGIASYGIEGFDDPERVASRGSDITFRVTRAALDRAGLTRDDIDAIVGAEQDGFTGITVSFGMKACAAGGYDKANNRVQNGGVFGIQLARAKIQAGEADCVVVATEDNTRFDETAVTNISHDPLYDRPMGMNHVLSHGLVASHHLETDDVTERDYAAVTAKNYRAGADNPWGHRSGPESPEAVLEHERVVGPLREPQTPAKAGGGAAVVVVSADLAADLDEEPVWIDGAGLGSSQYRTREMDRFLDQPSLAAAVDRAYDQAGVDDPREDLDFAEVFDPAPTFELLGYETLGLCDDGAAATLVRDGVTAPDGAFPVNPSGGALVTNPLNAGGLYRTIQAAKALRDEHPSVSLPDAERAVVTGGDVMLGAGGRTDGALVLGGGAS
jgi:acetyl-CoA C-acetyltransferase